MGVVQRSQTMNSFDDAYRSHCEYNFLDRLQVDVPELYRKHPPEAWTSFSGTPPFLHRSIFDPLYRMSCVPFRYRRLVRQVFRRIHLDLGWFYQFRQYWGNVLHGRPLWGVEDFFFLRNVYRMRFQYNIRIISNKDTVYSGPIDNGIDLFHSADGAVTIQRVEKSNVGKGKIGLHFFEAHGSSKRLDFKELWQKLMNVKIYVNKFIMISLDSCFFQ